MNPFIVFRTKDGVDYPIGVIFVEDERDIGHMRQEIAEKFNLHETEFGWRKIPMYIIKRDKAKKPPATYGDPW